MTKIVIAINPKSKYLTHGKVYTVINKSAGGYLFVRNDVGKKKAYSPNQFTEHEKYTSTILTPEQDHLTDPGKMVDNKVMLQRAYGWLRSHYPNAEVLHLQVEVIASYMARFAQEQIKSATILTPEQEEAKLKEAFDDARKGRMEVLPRGNEQMDWEYPSYEQWRNRK